jgi:hypothetical protein
MGINGDDDEDYYERNDIPERELTRRDKIFLELATEKKRWRYNKSLGNWYASKPGKRLLGRGAPFRHVTSHACGRYS